MAVVATTSLFALAGCAGDAATGSSDDPITIGWSLQLSGPIGPGSEYMVTAAQKAVDDINEAGGVHVDGTSRPLELKVIDNRSEVPTVTDQTRSLILEDEVDALFGPVITEFSVAGAAIAEQYSIPYFISSSPIDGFRAANPSGWTYAWNLFSSEKTQAETAVAGMVAADSNKKVALFSDTSNDGVTQHDTYVAELETNGFEIVADATFPLNTTDFSAAVTEAKASGADIAIAITFPVDGGNLIKEFKAQQFAPKIAQFPKSADGALWPGIAGTLGVGALGTGTWGVEDRGEGAEELDAYMTDAGAPVPLIAQGAHYYALVQFYAAAIEAAGSTDPAAVNDVIPTLTVDTVSGPVHFTDENVSEIPVYTWQWTGTTAEDMTPVQVFPNIGTALVTPPPGLAG
ncbi:ABC transporter substrate-binding protein [Microbacterium ulmi]|uniref:ABC transporter substrate-binding protein n=1 Tax=Microbacterium ulmi TaxID=179095 RepID=A0A7Y2Q144_9MICO|nr:ABC transporter substrate-binding protein [Microbacterium ulmi]NII68974.1 branched-chain amino acid transport system substrate-binding protein [Microbacterium ulmi]NNH03957.1 ABC transporter substrate-binding protein [Microbacterium ulmi]